MTVLECISNSLNNDVIICADLFSNYILLSTCSFLFASKTLERKYRI